MYQVIRAVMEYPSDSTLISLIYANRTEQDILLKPQLDEMATRYAGRFKVGGLWSLHFGRYTMVVMVL